MPDDEEPTVLINLEIQRKEGEREVTEGCLSLPGWQGYINRAEQVWARGVGLDGKPIRYKGVEDLLAQALEHECDHLDGILFVDHLKSKDDLFEVTEGDHGEDLNGIGSVPGIGARSPSYMARQLNDMKQGTRNGPEAALMKQVVANLTSEDILNITAYTASLPAVP